MLLLMYLFTAEYVRFLEKKQSYILCEKSTWQLEVAWELVSIFTNIIAFYSSSSVTINISLV